MKIFAIIPARLNSTRLPGKPLADIVGKSMIQRVYEQASKSKIPDKIIVATDHHKIYTHVKEFGGNVIMTSKDHKTGTERCAEAVSLINEKPDIVVNIQGDEPFFDPNNIKLLVSAFNSGEIKIATLITKSINEYELQSENTIKVVISNKDKKALYFSRSVIPFKQKSSINELNKAEYYYKHIGIYAFRYQTLTEIVKLKVSKLEKAESLEQLRWLENGHDIHTCETESECFSVDTYEDLENAIKKVKTTKIKTEI